MTPATRPPPRLVLHQHPIHEYGEQCRSHQGQQGQHQPAGERIGQRAPGVAEPVRDTAQDAGACAAALECGATFEAQRDSREALAELVRREGAAARRRVVEKEAVTVEAFQDEEVIELPEQDERKRQGLELIHLHGAAGAFEAIVPGGARDAGGAGAVAADLAFLAQLRERHPAPEIGKHAAETCGAALGRMHLQQEWRCHAPLHGFRGGLLTRFGGLFQAAPEHSRRSEGQ